jgi:hypothetical protein
MKARVAPGLLKYRWPSDQTLTMQTRERARKGTFGLGRIWKQGG